MDDNNDNSSGISLPQTAPASPVAPVAPPPLPVGGPMLAAPARTVDATVSTASKTAEDVGTLIMASSPDFANDGDLIEKEWVIQAKQIVGRTSQDPYMQTNEMNKLRQQYMQKRYGKTIEMEK